MEFFILVVVALIPSAPGAPPLVVPLHKELVSGPITACQGLMPARTDQMRARYRATSQTVVAACVPPPPTVLTQS